MHMYRLAPALLLSLFCALTVSADTVILTNGDTVSGNIRRMEDKTLVLQSHLLGTLRIKWDAVESIRSESRFSILTEAGDLWEGQVARQADRIEISSEGKAVTSLESDSIARIVPGTLRKGLVQLLRASTGAADIGYSLARGNQNQTQSSLGARADYRSVLYKFSGRLDSLFARQDGARSQSRHALKMRLDRFLNARAFSYALSGWERNERRRLDLRTQLGGGIGWHLRQDKAMDFSVLGGFAYVHERFRDLDNRATGEHASLDAAPQTTHRNGDAHDVDGVCRRRDRGEISHRSETRTDREDGQQQIDQEQDDEVGGGNRSLQKHEDSDVDRYREHAGENDDAESCWNAPRKTREKVLRGRG